MQFKTVAFDFVNNEVTVTNKQIDKKQIII